MEDQLLQQGILQANATIEDVTPADEAVIEAELPLENDQEPQQPEAAQQPGHYLSGQWLRIRVNDRPITSSELTASLLFS